MRRCWSRRTSRGFCHSLFLYNELDDDCRTTLRVGGVQRKAAESMVEVKVKDLSEPRAVDTGCSFGGTRVDASRTRGREFEVSSRRQFRLYTWRRELTIDGDGEVMLDVI